ncbi:MAG: carbamoyl transferase NodU family protein [Actinomycetota bacterium]|nr:carbamoyl transferase NodU family protein [Actinomycetota bacterium]
MVGYQRPMGSEERAGHSTLTVSIFFGGHDSNVAIADGSRTLLHLEAERVLRRKHARANAEEMQSVVQAALDYVSADVQDVTEVLLAAWSSDFDPNGFELLGRWVVPIVTGHHANHIACAFGVGFETGLALCADGGSEDGMTSIYAVTGHRVRRLARLDDSFTTGRTYGTVTQLVVQPQFRAAHSTDAGKLLGLAAHGSKDEAIRSLIVQHEAALKRLHTEGVDELLKAFGLADGYSRPWEDARRRDVAATMQDEWEKRLLQLLGGYQGPREVALVGGCAMNVVANGRLARAGLFDRVHIPFAASDAGQALGALWNRRPHLATADPYLGRGFGRDLTPAVAGAIAEDLIAGRTVALYHGRSESGPRALGHRSILAIPSSVDVRRNLSERIKGREPYRPVAPVIREEDLERFFNTTVASRYMCFAHSATAVLRREAPAIVHADGTSRVQTVAKQQEPVLHAILERLAELGKLPVLANTSMNVAGEPMVDSPAEALRFFARAPVDVLWLGDERHVGREAGRAAGAQTASR